MIYQKEYDTTFRAWLWSENEPTWKQTKPSLDLIEHGLTRKQLRITVDEINQISREIHRDHTTFTVCLRILSLILILCVIILMVAPNTGRGLHVFAAVTLAAVIIFNAVQIGYCKPIEHATDRALEAVSNHVVNIVNDEYRTKQIEWELVVRVEIKKWMNCYIGTRQYRHITVAHVARNNHLLNTDLMTDRCDDNSVSFHLDHFPLSERMLCEEKTKDTMGTQESGSKSKALLLANDDYINLNVM